MILARLSRAVREQNWFAVVLEFFIVIVGVVIAFQVTAWNEARQDRADAYVRDGLQPWSDQLSRLHEQIDRILGIDHTDEDSL